MIPGKQAVKALLIDSSTWASRSLSTIVIQGDAVNANRWEGILLKSNERRDCSMDDQPNLAASPFDAIWRVDEQGHEYWNARDLAKLLGYSEYSKFYLEGESEDS